MSNKTLYPLRFEPILKEKIWGGDKLKTVLNKSISSPQTGESWEISAVPESVSVVTNGELAGKSLTDLIAEYDEDFLGKTVKERFGDQYPLLFKFIDAKENLSLQLHPDDKLAMQRHNSFGKTEMWYVMQADEGAGLYVGFHKGTTQADYIKHLENETLQDIMNYEPVKTGDVFFIKTGLVHAIGEGVLLAEIQQSSDITYRVFDWNRKDKNGQGRELHTELAVDAIDFDFDEFKVNYSSEVNRFENLVENKYFKTQKLNLSGLVDCDYTQRDSFVVYMCVEGEATVESNGTTELLKKGDSLLLPACIKHAKLEGKNAQLLEVSIS